MVLELKFDGTYFSMTLKSYLRKKRWFEYSEFQWYLKARKNRFYVYQLDFRNSIIELGKSN